MCQKSLRSDVVLFYLTYVSRRTSSGEASDLGGTPEQAISKLDDCVFIDEIASYIEILGFDIDRSLAILDDYRDVETRNTLAR